MRLFGVLAAAFWLSVIGEARAEGPERSGIPLRLQDVIVLARQQLDVELDATLAFLMLREERQYVRTSWPFDEQASGKPATVSRSEQESHATHGDAPAGYSAVTIEPAQAEAIGLASAPVQQRELTRTVRSVGTLALDETRSAHVHAKVRGWIDTIQANFVGRAVRAGQPLCSSYSQDVYAAEAELVALLDRPVDDPLVAAGRRRLALWDVPKAEIERLKKSREPMRTFSLLSPRSGVIISKSAIQGTYVDPSTELHAADHRAAAAALRDAEVRGCVGINPNDRDTSPFDRVEDIAGVETLNEEVGSKVRIQRTFGAVITFRARPGMTVEWLQRVMECHLARNAALGHVVPEMPNCPLVPKGVQARVTSTGTASRLRSARTTQRSHKRSWHAHNVLGAVP